MVLVHSLLSNLKNTIMAEKRDNKGRFTKGNKEGRKFANTSARENGGSAAVQDAAAAGHKGGHNAMIKAAQRRTYADIAIAMGELPASEVDKANLHKLGLPDHIVKNATQDAVVVAAQLMQAKAGNSTAARWLRDTKGESVQNVNVQGGVNITGFDVRKMIQEKIDEE